MRQTLAEQLEAFLNSAERKSPGQYHHWIQLDYPADRLEHQQIYGEIVTLWTNVKDRRVRNRAQLEEWNDRAKSVMVR